ncbi:reprolysin [Aphelenchoides avenae]|nr:reprolysin [Aphelenchus avenae]
MPDETRCPIELKLSDTSESLNAQQLVDKSKHVAQDFHVILHNSAFPDQTLDLHFKPNRDLLGEQVKEQPSSSSKGELCHFEAVTEAREHNALSACSVDLITGAIQTGNKAFVLGHDDNGFYLTPKDDPSCAWPKGRSKRADHFVPNTPHYYKEYLDDRKRFYKKYGEDETKVHDRLHSIANVVNSLYSQLNVRVTLVWADIWKKGDIFEVTADSDRLLTQFLAYRKAILPEHPHDNAHLITDVRFNGEVIGKAYKGTMCSYDFSGGVIVDHSPNSAFVGGTVAHEMGHNFGMEHDAGYPDPCKCAARSCIMAPSSGGANSTTFWSDCSLEYLQHALKRGVDYCLQNVPKTAFGGAKCGNGVLEDGEECDCGNTVACPNKCCIASKCKLAEGAMCADGDCCDTKLCKPRRPATVCRSAANDCDLPEFCDGVNPSCPADFFVQNGHKCPGETESYCYEGVCGSRDQQCRFIWGQTGKNSAPECYPFNRQGSIYGNCGYDHTTDRYQRCAERDVMCGRLHCQHLSEKPEFGDPSSVYSAYSFVRLTTGQDVACRVIRTTYVGGKRQKDPGMVPDGAPCGDNKMCLNAQCTNNSEVVQMVSKCEPESCNDKGICNNVGNCHCVNGYGGTACDIPGYGGSVNSGPANDTVFNPGMVVLWLLIAAIIGFVAATVYCKRRKNFWLHKEIWRHAKKVFKLHSIRVPVRKAPPPPGGRHGGRHSLTDPWGDRPSNVLRVGRADATHAPTVDIRPVVTPHTVPATTYQFSSPDSASHANWQQPTLITPTVASPPHRPASGGSKRNPTLGVYPREDNALKGC